MMNKMCIATFFAGATIGGFATWLCIKKYYEQRAQEDIDSVKSTYAQKHPTTSETKSDISESAQVQVDENPELLNYKKVVESSGYTDYSQYGENKESDILVDDEIQLISPDDFGYADEEYETITLVYYSDGVLANDDLDEEIENVGDLVGYDFVNHFGDYDEDVVYIRNNRLKCDFEIVKDNRSYAAVIERKPYLHMEE